MSAVKGLGQLDLAQQGWGNKHPVRDPPVCSLCEA